MAEEPEKLARRRAGGGLLGPVAGDRRGRPGAGADLTTLGRWKLRRDLVIYLAHRKGGASTRLLGEVFDLVPSRITAIVKRLEAEQGHGRAGGIGDGEIPVGTILPN